MGSILGDIYDLEKDKLHKRNNDNKRFCVGDRVWNMRFGWGTVKKYDEGFGYSVYVVFDNDDIVEFTDDGKEHWEDLCPSLFFEEIAIPETALKKTKWRAKEEEKYYVVDAVGGIARHTENRTYVDTQYWECGNYFKTKDDAENSAIYKAFKKMK